MTPVRLARIILAKIGCIGCSVGAYLSYGQPDRFGYFLMFALLAAVSVTVLFVDVSKGDNDDDDYPNFKLRH